jgi:hypothetical protein
VVTKLKIRKRPPSMIRNINGGPSRGARAGDPGAPTINAKKRQRRAPGRCLDIPCAPLSGVGNGSRLPIHVPSSNPRPRRSDPPLLVRKAPKE